jgi:hypothetical protein
VVQNIYIKTVYKMPLSKLLTSNPEHQEKSGRGEEMGSFRHETE